MEIFAKRLLEFRKEKGISQAMLAKKLQVSFAVVCYWETNRSEPTAPNLVKLADFFDVSNDYLLGRKNIKRTQIILRSFLLAILWRCEQDKARGERAYFFKVRKKCRYEQDKAREDNPRKFTKRK